jgi:hypothetical protein
MANCIIAFPNRFDEATLSNGSWPTLTLANLKTTELNEMARSANALLTSTKMDIVLTRPRGIKLLAFVGHNLELTAKYRITVATSADFSVLAYDSGWLDVWPPVYSSASLEWEDENWWAGRLSEEDRAGWRWTLVHVLDAALAARFWRVEFDDTTNTSGYVQLARVFMSGQWQPVINMSPGAGIGWEPRTTADTALSGSKYFDERESVRVARFTLEDMSTDEAFGRAFEIDRRAGISKEVFYVFDPEDTLHMMRRSFLGRLRELSPIEHPYTVGLMSKNYEIEESV